jgi:hypothetical protein
MKLWLKKLEKGDYVESEALTAMGMKSSIFWDITACRI